MTGRLGALTIVWFIMSPHVHAQANTDPWQRVPALPTSCFADDGMETTFRELRAVIEDDFRRQRELNLELRKKFENMDVMEKTQRMQAYMQKNPQEAVKMMQAQEQTATGMSADASGAAADREKLMAQRDQLKIAFAKAISDGAGPVEARIQQYVDAKTVLAGEIGPGISHQSGIRWLRRAHRPAQRGIREGLRALLWCRGLVSHLDGRLQNQGCEEIGGGIRRPRRDRRAADGDHAGADRSRLSSPRALHERARLPAGSANSLLHPGKQGQAERPHGDEVVSAWCSFQTRRATPRRRRVASGTADRRFATQSPPPDSAMPRCRVPRRHQTRWPSARGCPCA